MQQHKELTQRQLYRKDWNFKNREHLREYNKQFYQTPVGVYSGIANSANKREIAVCSKEEFIDWYTNAPKECVYCSIPEIATVQFVTMSGQACQRLTVDRMDNNRGYIVGNLTLACYPCNMIKSSIFSFEEMKELGQAIKNIWKRRRLV